MLTDSKIIEHLKRGDVRPLVEWLKSGGAGDEDSEALRYFAEMLDPDGDTPFQIVAVPNKPC